MPDPTRYDVQVQNFQPALSDFLGAIDERRERRALSDIGGMAASGNLSAAAAKAYAAGKPDLAIRFDTLDADRQGKVVDLLGRMARSADSPEKWQSFVSSVGQRFPHVNMAQYSDFKARDALVAEFSDPDKEAELALSRDRLALDRQKFEADKTRPDFVTMKPGEILFDKNSGKTTEPTLPDGSTPKPAPNFDDEAKLRSEFIKGSGDYMTVRDSFGRLQAAAQDDTNAGHIATVYAFMKMLDPGSVVRESEYATAENAAGVPDTVRNLWNRVLDGQRLPPELRANIIAQGERQFEAATERQKAYSETYSGLSGAYGFDPARITPDLSGGVKKKPAGGGTVIDGYSIQEVK